MKTIDQLQAVTQLEDGALFVANSEDNTETNKVSFANLKNQIRGSLVTDVSISGVTISASHADGSSATTVTVPSATNAAEGVTKLYNTTGNNTDGAITQNAVTSAISGIKYVSGASVSGTTVTLTVNNDSDITFNTQDTHYASSTVVAASNSATSNTATTNTTTYLNHVENGSVTSSHKITGTGATTVSADGNGVITINTADPILGTAAAKNIYDTYDSTSEDAISGKGVAAALATLPEPMVFKGSLGQDGTITTLPAASNTGSSKNTGFTYKVITDGTYQGIAAEAGDTFISTGTNWILVPSGDEPSGTVTSVAVSSTTGLTVSGSPVTSSGTITIDHSDTSDQASVSNTGRTYIQSVTLDDMGHVTGLTSATETVTDTWTPYTGATSSSAGTGGYIGTGCPAAGYNTHFYRGDGTWVNPLAGTIDCGEETAPTS